MAWFKRASATNPVHVGGVIWAWGENDHGQLGSGTQDQQSIPTALELSNVISIVAGTECAFALQADGTVWSWGFNDFGKLGDGTEQDSSSPVRLDGLHGVVQLAAGARTSYALTDVGEVLAWGGNPFHELGVGPDADWITPRRQSDGFVIRSMNSAEVGSPNPVKVTGLSRISAIAAGGSRAFALDSDGTVWAWGDNQRGRIGDGTTFEHLTPVAIRTLPRVVAIAAAEMAAFALDSAGRVWAWGSNYNGELGDGTKEDRSAPVLVAGLSGVKEIAAGHSSAFALGTGGTVWGWGKNSQGQLGIGHQNDVSTPAHVAGLSNVRSIAAGWAAAYAVISDGSVWAWGNNDNGQLGDPTRADSLVPVQLAGFSGITEIAARKNSAYALASGADPESGYSQPTSNTQSTTRTESREPGSVWAWGDNFTAQVGDGSRDNRLSPTLIHGLDGVTEISFSGGQSFSYDGRIRALRNDGTVWAWGGRIVNNSLDGSRVPERVDGVADVVTLKDGFAVKQDGTVWDLRVIYLNESPQQLPDLSDATAVHPVEPLLYVARNDGTTAVIELDSYSWDHKGSYYWGGKQRPLEGPGELTSIVTWTDFASTNSWEDGYYRFDVGLTKDGAVWQWRVENLGTDVPNKSMAPFGVRDEAYALPGLTDATSIGAGDDFCVAVTRDGTVWTWGRNDKGQLGDGTGTDRPMPAQVEGLPPVVAIEPLGPSCFALADDGTVWAWGRNDDGRLGDGSSEDQPRPVKLPGLADVCSIHAGFAIKRDGSVWAWGQNEGGRLANGTTSPSNTPQQVPGLSDVASMASRESTWFAITHPSGGTHVS